MIAKRVPIVFEDDLPHCEACGLAVPVRGLCGLCAVALVPVEVPAENVIEPEELLE